MNYENWTQGFRLSQLPKEGRPVLLKSNTFNQIRNSGTKNDMFNNSISISIYLQMRSPLWVVLLFAT